MGRLWCLWQLLVATETLAGPYPCGGILKDQRGILQTPGFPAPFPVPIRCRWVIDNSQQDNSSVTIYLTQMFVTSGLTFSEVSDLGGRTPVHRVTSETATKVKWLRSSAPYLVVEFSLDQLEGNHVRAADHLLNVFGFNVTYDTAETTTALTPSCSIIECSFSGHCYAAADFRHFYCSCFKGFSLNDCGQGPLCNTGPNKCQKNTTCRQFGSAVAYYQPDCEHVNHVQNCTRRENTNSSSSHAVFQITLKLANFSNTDYNEQCIEVLEQQIVKCLLGNLPNTTKLQIQDIMSLDNVVFSLRVERKEMTGLKEDLDILLESVCLGNHSVGPVSIAIRQEPPLHVQDIHINHDKTIIREGEEFIVSCLARGSSLVSINWLKDGVLVNISKSVRNMWTELLGPDTRGTYTAVLGVEKANILDSGTFTCQATDWGIHQCLSISLDIVKPPEVTILPRSLTVDKGGNAQFICMSRDDTKYSNFKYSWTQGKALLPIIPDKIVWEDLLPIGTILNIYNIQDSNSYTCHVDLEEEKDGDSSSGLSGEGTVEVVVAATACTPELGWPGAAPSSTALIDCPPPLRGIARRRCEPGGWQDPNYSSCVHPELSSIRDTLMKLSFGYQNTTISETLYRCLRYLKRRKTLYSGEGEQIVSLLALVQNFSSVITYSADFLLSVYTFYDILNYLLENPYSIKSEEIFTQLLELTTMQAVLWSGMLLRTKHAHVSLSAVVVDILVSKNASVIMYQFPLLSSSYPSWMNVNLTVTLEIPNDELFKSSNVTIVIIAYKNLSTFLQEKSFINLRGREEVRYAAAAVLVSARVVAGGQDWRPELGRFTAALTMMHGSPPPAGWSPRCILLSAAMAAIPRLDFASCDTVMTTSLLTTCSCSQPGYYTILLTAPLLTAQDERLPGDHSISVVVLSCMICLVQTLATLILLLPSWWRHPSSLIFLKLQCCAATSGAMAIFIYGVQHSSNKNASLFMAASLEVFLLVGTTSHLGKVFIVYIEVVQLSRSPHINKIIVSTTTGFSLVAVLCIHLAHQLMDWTLTPWWLLFGAKLSIIFIMTVGFILAVDIFLYISITNKLRLFCRSMVLDTRTIDIRMQFLNRGAIVQLFIIIMLVSNLSYVNLHILQYSYLFGCSTILLGFVTATCYLWKSEVPLCPGMVHNLQVVDSVSDENVSTSTQLKSTSTQEIGPGVLKNLESSSTGGQQKKLLMKTSKESTSGVPLHDVNISTVENVMNTGGDFLDDTIFSGLHPSTSTVCCSAVKPIKRKNVHDTSTAHSRNKIQNSMISNFELGTLESHTQH